MKAVVILISAGAVDGYPPVQHQARLLAESGFQVELITTPLKNSRNKIVFSHPGVVIHKLPFRIGGGLNSVKRLMDFFLKITLVRIIHIRRPLFEIAYDPQGIFYSDLSLLRPKWRIAHFHEILQFVDKQRLEKRLKTSINSFQKVVVADPDRAIQIHKQLQLDELPISVPNFPQLATDSYYSREKHEFSAFEVIYCGAIGTHQKLDFIIESVIKWPPNTIFTIFGDDQSDIGEELKKQVARLGLVGRVKFEGWIDYSQLTRRLSQADIGISLLDPSFKQWRTALNASNKRYQYMQAGLSQIGDMNPGVTDFLENQGVGRSIGSFCPEELAQIVKDYVSKPFLCKEEGERAASLHMTKYNYEKAFAPILDWLDDKLKQKFNTRNDAR